MLGTCSTLKAATWVSNCKSWGYWGRHRDACSEQDPKGSLRAVIGLHVGNLQRYFVLVLFVRCIWFEPVVSSLLSGFWMFMDVYGASEQAILYSWTPGRRWWNICNHLWHRAPADKKSVQISPIFLV